MEAGERFAIAAVGLDAIPGLCGNERGGDDHTVMADRGQLTKDPIAAGTGLVAERQHLPGRAQFLHKLRHRLWGVGDLPVIAGLALTGFGDRYRDGVFVCIQPYILAKLRHDLPPQLWL